MPIDNVLKHGLNNLIIFADFVLVRIPVASYHFQVGLPRLRMGHGGVLSLTTAAFALPHALPLFRSCTHLSSCNQ